MSKRRVLIVGLDGATFDIITPMVQSGRLPTCARLMNEGAWGPLRSTIPPLTPPGWASFATGRNPGKHGVYGFYGYENGSYETSLVTGLSVRAKRFWEYLDRERIGLVDIPMTFPPQEINGYMISGEPVPSSESIFTYPPELHTEIIRKVGDYMIEKAAAIAYSQTKNLIEAVELLYRVTEIRRNTALFLLTEKGPFDCFCAVYHGTDWIQHGALKFLDEVYCKANPEKCAKYKALIFQYYEEMDAMLAEMIKAMGEDAVVIVLSDHGGAPMEKQFYINRWLRREGLLELNRWAWPDGLRLHREVLGALLQGAGVGPLNRLLPSRLQRMPIPYVRLQKAPPTIDWERTKAFSSRFWTDGVIRINLEGREPLGIVPRREYEELRGDIIARLLALRDPESGEPVVEAAYKREEVYHGPYVEDAPDILVLAKNDRNGFSPALHDGAILERPIDPDCRHQMDGIFMIKGPDIKSGRMLAGLNIVDVAPTVLHLLEKPIPDDMDGKVIIEAMEEEDLATSPPRYFRAGDAHMPKGHDQVFTAAEQERIESSLRALGYIE